MQFVLGYDLWVDFDREVGEFSGAWWRDGAVRGGRWRDGGGGGGVHQRLMLID